VTRAEPGVAVVRNEDEPLLRGVAEYLPDLHWGQLHAVFVRSTVASARITAIRTKAAEGADGVVAVFTGEDFSLGRIRGHASGAVPAVFDRPPLAREYVRFVGDPVAVVVAETRDAAVDAAELVEVEYEELPVLIDPEAALAPDAFVLFPDNGENGNKATEAAMPYEGDLFEGADVVVKGRFVNRRVHATPMETNGAMAIPEEGGGVTVWASTQRVHALRDEIAEVLGAGPDQVRVVTPQVGGGFGAKYDTAAEVVALAAVARRVGRAVTWYETRSESMTALFHGRGQVQYCELGLERDGTFVGIKADIIGDAGGYPMIGALISGASLRMLAGIYAIPRVDGHAVSTATNTTPVGAYRGAGRPEACAMIERIVDMAAQELGMDPVELRRKNLPASDRFPIPVATGFTYDSGDYHKALDMACSLVGYESLRKEQAERRRRGDAKQLGIGVIMWLDATPMNRPGEYASADITVGPDGKLDVAVRTGTMDHGQGHATTWGLILSGILGVPVESVRMVRSDTAVIPTGIGTGSARTLQTTGSSVKRVGGHLLDQARAVAAHLLEASPDDIVVTQDARLGVAGSPGTSLSWEQVAMAAADKDSLPAEVAALLGPVGLSAESDITNEGPTFPYGCHIAVTEVDIETGGVKLVNFVAVDDCGVVVNPTTVTGQQHGGIVQGIGQAMYEEIAYDELGNPLSSTFADYLVPSAADVCSIDAHRIETPTTLNPLGAKGIGQGGAVGATPAVQNSVIDAVSHLGVRHIDMPVSPQRVWRAIQDARSTE
jgi:carbon-monoxide dehydrogenase large subunit